MLVIDASTNITFSACDDVGEYTGGAMLPGIGSMLRLVNSQGVRNPTELPDSLPARWATSTEELVHSGVIHTVLAGIAAYTSEYSKKCVFFHLLRMTYRRQNALSMAGSCENAK